MSSRFERLEAHTVFEGSVVDVREGAFRHQDGETVTRQWVAAPDSVGVVAHDGELVWLVRQPREAIGVPDLLELPAGKLDVKGEEPLECGKRELGEEIGKAAEQWEHLVTFYTSPGFTDERCHVFLATGLRDAPELTANAHERIEVVTRRIAELDAVLDHVADSKTLIGLQALRARL